MTRVHFHISLNHFCDPSNKSFKLAGRIGSMSSLWKKKTLSLTQSCKPCLQIQLSFYWESLSYHTQVWKWSEVSIGVIRRDKRRFSQSHTFRREVYSFFRFATSSFCFFDLANRFARSFLDLSPPKCERSLHVKLFVRVCVCVCLCSFRPKNFPYVA